MNGFGNWLRQLLGRIRMGFARFMEGRYGTDKLNTTILLAGVIFCIAAMFMPSALIKMIFTIASYGLMFLAIFRAFSRNTYKRYQENRKYLMLLERIKDKEHRYFDCPRCRQPVRVPKGKGKIAITCPKCREKFIKRT